MILNVLLFILAILKFVFFLVLAIIGIILLIVLVLCAIILFTPIRHNITFRCKENFLYFHMKVYIIKKLKVDIYYRNNKLEIVSSIKKKEADKREQKKKRVPKENSKKKGNSEPNKQILRNEGLLEKKVDHKLYTQQNSQNEGKQGEKESVESIDENRSKLSSASYDTENTPSVSHIKSSYDDNGASEGNSRSSKESQYNAKRSSKENKGTKREANFSKKIGKKPKKPSKDLNEWILYIQEMIEKGFWFLECYGNEKIFKWLKKSFSGILSIFHLETCAFYGVYGNVSNPKMLGQLLGMFYTLKGVFYLKNFTLVGDFQKDIYDITFYSKGKIQFYKIVFPIVALGYFVLKASLKAFKIDFKYVVSLVKEKFKSFKKKKS